MTTKITTTKISGLWLPLITPFKDGAIDFASYDRLVNHYIAKGVDGLLPLGTTGESPALDEDEIAAVIERTLAVANGRVPVFAGVGGNATAKVEKELKRLRHLPIAGILSVCPYYNRPSQDGLIAHFRRIAAATDRDVVIYNIPYRTAVNLSNDSLLELAEMPNIVGVKDSSGSVEQSLELLRRKPADFAVLTGEDALFFTMRANGAEGGILAASHLMTEGFVEVERCFSGQRSRRRPQGLGAARRLRADAVRRSQSDADQASPVAAGADRLAGMPAAAHEDLRRAGPPARRGVRREEGGLGFSYPPPP